jgi:hypothetical protein
MELLKKFLNGKAPDTAGGAHEDLEMWSKVRELGALCTHLDDTLPRH